METHPRLAVVDVGLIVVGKRFREVEGDIEGLANSLKTYGIIQPLAVKQEGVQYRLIAGGRRMAAINMAEIKDIPIRIFDDDLTEIELRLLELEENIQRKDLEWLERSRLDREIHNLRVEIHGEKTSTSPDAEGWSLRDTANLLGRDPGGVSRSVNLAETVETFTDVDWSTCKTQSDAEKLSKKLQEGLIRRELARRVDEESKAIGANKFKKRLMDSYILMNFLDGVKNVPDGSVDFCEIDPPYAIDLENIKKNYNYSDMNYHERIESTYVEFVNKVLIECYRVMRPDSWLVMWFGPEPWFENIHDAIVNAGFKTSRLTGVWAKGSGQCRAPSVNFANSVEHFFYARKGSPTLSKQGRSNLFNFKPVPPSNKIHPTERPPELMAELLDIFTIENATIMVPFAGSGVTILQSFAKKRKAFGYDLSQEFRESFLLRVAELY